MDTQLPDQPGAYREGNWRQDWKAFLGSFRDPDFNAARQHDLSMFTVWMTLITAVFVATTILWDYSLDPERAFEAVGLRIVATVAVLVMALIFYARPGSVWAYLAFLAGPLFVNILFIEILRRLAGATDYGIGGFLYFFIFIPVIGRAFSLPYNIFVLFALTLTPTVVHLLGYADHLNMQVYHAYVWMVLGPVLAVLVLSDFLYWQLYRYRQELAMQADHDALTGLANRRHLFNVAEKLHAAAKRDQQPASLLFLDLDYFKDVNDKYGHAVGDSALQWVSRSIEPVLRESDLMARIGGEEFVIWLHGCDALQAFKVGEKIRQRLMEQPFVVRETEHSHPLTVSIGIAAFRPDQEMKCDIETLMRRADDALRRAKTEGRNCTRVSGWQDEVMI